MFENNARTIDAAQTPIVARNHYNRSQLMDNCARTHAWHLHVLTIVIDAPVSTYQHDYFLEAISSLDHKE